MLSTIMDMERQIIDIQHPMYDIMVNASASIDYNERCIHTYYTATGNICYLFWFIFSGH